MKSAESHRLGVDLESGQLLDGAHSNNNGGGSEARTESEQVATGKEREALLKAHRIIQEESKQVEDTGKKVKKQQRGPNADRPHRRVKSSAGGSGRVGASMKGVLATAADAAASDAAAAAADDYDGMSLEALLKLVERSEDDLRNIPWRERNRYEKQARAWNNPNNPYRKSVVIAELRAQGASKQHSDAMEDIRQKKKRAHDRKRDRNRMLFAVSGRKNAADRSTGQSSMTVRIQKLNRQLGL